jgi:hypothetical protein
MWKPLRAGFRLSIESEDRCLTLSHVQSAKRLNDLVERAAFHEAASVLEMANWSELRMQA